MINFTKDELYWIERTADLESAICMNNFFNLVKIDLTNLTEAEKEELRKCGSEYIDLHLFLKKLRIKLELERKGMEA